MNTNITVKTGTITYTPQTSVLQQAGVTTTAISPATTSSSGALQLPVSGGSFNNNSYAGSVNTNGGVKFSGSGGRSVSLTNFSFNTQNGVVTAEANGQRVQLFQLGDDARTWTTYIRGTLSTISTSSNRITYAPLTTTAVRTGGVALDQGLGVVTFTPGIQVGTFASSITYSC